MRRQGQWLGTGPWTAAAGVAVLLLVGACTTEPDPVPTASEAVVTPTVAPSPTPSPPEKPTRPEVPAEMAEPTKEGAEAAARYFSDLFDYAFASGDTAPFEALSGQDCDFCSRIVDQVEQAVDDGLLTDRDPAEITDISVVEVRPGEWFNVEFRRRQGEIRLLGSDGAVLQSEPQGPPLHYALALSWAEGWAVDAVGVREDTQ